MHTPLTNNIFILNASYSRFLLYPRSQNPNMHSQVEFGKEEKLSGVLG
ncbi:hypothetical protein THERMOS_1703 [Bathymodiolus thermophilus thioautotrophic gill symbiont]|uniref:Uncharacterized protein n=1 Tax=Bathymodiolus thermophilus thioautotrophic gill symbiont TaxID=2360 RepID=A0A8H8XDR2_9GAMM|nr:hypothetical protein THERMOS_1703 [Bathymodiolus thermophilus thioautotrophic gill symbiont]